MTPFAAMRLAAGAAIGASASAILHFEGTNGSTTIIDSSPIGNTFTATSPAAISTAQARYGSSSLNPGTKGVSCPVSSNFLFGNGAFTVEASIYKTGASTGAICTVWGTGGGLSWYMGIDGSNKLVFFINTVSGGTSFSLVSLAAVPTTGWADLAVVQMPGGSGDFYLYINGTRSGIFSGGVSTLQTASGPFTVGMDSDGNNAINVPIDEVRVTKGYALYTGASYTPGPFSP